MKKRGERGRKGREKEKSLVRLENTKKFKP
jgi:hypothetical protein